MTTDSVCLFCSKRLITIFSCLGVMCIDGRGHEIFAEIGGSCKFIDADFCKFDPSPPKKMTAS